MKLLNFKAALVIVLIGAGLIGANAFYTNLFKEGCLGICTVDLNSSYASQGSTLKGDGRPTYNQLAKRATANDKEASNKRVFVIDYNSGFSLASSQHFGAKVDEIKGAAIEGDIVILRITSPGGSALACSSDYNKIVGLRERGIKVIATVDYAALSCGYYLASGANLIFADTGAWVGNIGAVMVLDASKAAKERTIVGSTRAKEIMVGGVAKTDGDIEIIQKVVNMSFESFRDAVLAGRGNRINVNDYELVFSTLPFSGNIGLELGLVDGNLTSDAILEELYYKGYRITLVNYVVKKPLIQKLITG